MGKDDSAGIGMNDPAMKDSTTPPVGGKQAEPKAGVVDR